jgi:hypothetical protein
VVDKEEFFIETTPIVGGLNISVIEQPVSLAGEVATAACSEAGCAPASRDVFAKAQATWWGSLKVEAGSHRN